MALVMCCLAVGLVLRPAAPDFEVSSDPPWCGDYDGDGEPEGECPCDVQVVYVAPYTEARCPPGPL